MVNLKYDWLMIISSGGAVVSFYHVISWYTYYIRLSTMSEPQILIGFGYDLV